MMKKRKFSADNAAPDEEQEICKLSSKRKVSLTVWKGTRMLNIREYYVKDGKELPSPKGICLPLEQWKELRKHVKAIDAALGIIEEKEEEEAGAEEAIVNDKENKLEGEVC